MLVMLGDDKVTLEHAIELYRALPDGELAVISGASHGLLVEKGNSVAKQMRLGRCCYIP
jgi:pimeloyl-ACP methyl ester carboxylesterase